MQTQVQRQGKGRAKFSRRNVLIAIIIVGAIVIVGILAWKNWASILSVWNKTLWLHWVIFVGVVLLTVVTALLWVFRSKGIVRRSRTIIIVLGAIAIGTGVWLLSYFHEIPDAWSTIMLVIFTASALAFAFLQWMAPIPPLSSDQSNMHSATPQISPAITIPPTRSSSPKQPLNGITDQSPIHGPLPATENAPQTANNIPGGSIDFFVSYASADRDVAKWIEAVLWGEKYSTFFAEYDMGPGTNIAQELNQAAAKAKRTLLVLSPDYPLAEHPEWAVAFYKDMSGKERRLIPVYVRKCPEQLQGILAPLVPIDLVDKSESEARRLLLDGAYFGDKRKRQTRSPKFPGLSAGNPGTSN